MTTFTAYFRTDTSYALYEIEAETPHLALERARLLYADAPEDLTFESYEGHSAPVDEIEICDDDDANLQSGALTTSTCVWPPSASCSR